MKYNATVFPVQKLPMKKKGDKWKEACVDYIVNMGETAPSGSDGTMHEKMKVNYDLYNSIFNEDDLKHATNPFDQEDGFPAVPQNFNIIKPKVDLLIGEEASHPFVFKIARTSQSAASDAQEKMKMMLYQYIMGQIVAGMSEEEAQLFQEKLATGEIVPPEKIAEFMEKDYKDIAESTAYHSMRYLKEKLNLDHEYLKAFKDALISSMEVYYTGIKNGEPYQERVNPMYFACDRSPDIEFIEDGDWAVRKLRMSYTEIYDRLKDKMTEKDLDKMIDMVSDGKGSSSYGKDMPSSTDYNHIKMRVVTPGVDDNVNANNILNLWHCTWKSYRKINIVTLEDEYGVAYTDIFSEDYILTGDEINIEEDWILETWEGYRIGEDLYVGINPIEYQFSTPENLNSQKLPYSGVIYNNSNSEAKSMVELMKPIQYLYIIVWYRLELALARDKGKVITMDITQIPKSMNIDPAKWLHYLSSVGVNFVNPYDEGWDIPGREGGKPSQFNQITEMDLSMANTIGQYIGILDKLEQMIGEICGVTKQREGAISNRELVGAVERSVVQSSLITEHLFWMHNQAKKNALKLLLNTAKYAWAVSGRTHLQYFLNDSSRAFLELDEGFFYEDYDIFVTDSSKEMQHLEAVKSLYQPALQNGASIVDIAEIISLDNVSEIRTKLKEIEAMRMKQNEQAAEAENQRQMQLIQAEAEVRQIENQFKAQELELSKYKIDADNQTKIQVAQLNAYRNKADVDSDGDGTPDVMEIADYALRQQAQAASEHKNELDADIKRISEANKIDLEKRKVAAQEKAEEKKASIEDKKIKLEEKKLRSQEKLQRIKDKAAMEREVLKARTALKNKTAGEK